MPHFGSEIDKALSTMEPIPREKVILWIESAADLATLSKLYSLTYEAYHRIQPELGREATCGLIQNYLLECIRQNVTGSDEIEGRWEAAGTLHQWFCHLIEMEDTHSVVESAAQSVRNFFLHSEDDVRLAIEQGFGTCTRS